MEQIIFDCIKSNRDKTNFNYIRNIDIVYDTNICIKTVNLTLTKLVEENILKQSEGINYPVYSIIDK